MKTLTLVTALGMMISTVALAGDTIKFRDEKTGAEYGPVKVANGVRIKVGETTLAVTVVEQTEAQKALEKKLKAIMIPEMQVAEAPFGAAVAFLRDHAKKTDPDKRGVNILAIGLPYGDAEPRLTLELRNVSLYDALRYCCEAAGLLMRIDDNAVVISLDPKK
ncbi:MAG: hypothetical protein WCL49_08555 [bacterium]